MAGLILAVLALAAAPAPPTPPDAQSAAAAVRLVEAYYAAVDRRDYRTAFRLWHGRYSFAEMKAGYANTAHVRVTAIPPFRIEGAAGSSYCTVPVEVASVEKDGRRQRFRGSFTLRRVNDVDGATAAQRHWHIESARLKQVG